MREIRNSGIALLLAGAIACALPAEVHGQDELEITSRFRSPDPNYSRLLLAPTAKPLQQGAGFFADTWIFFPSVSYGFTNNFSMMAGMTLFPFAKLTDQVIYFSPKIGAQFTKDFALSVGAIYFRLPDEVEHFAFGIAYAVTTVGQANYHVTGGVGFGYIKEEGEDFEFGGTPAGILGGYLRTSEVSALILETWFNPSGDVKITDQPFGFGVRLFGQRIAVDVALLTTLEVLTEGRVIPWVTAVYNFGVEESW